MDCQPSGSGKNSYGCFACSERGGASWEIAGEAAASNEAIAKPMTGAIVFITISRS